MAAFPTGSPPQRISNHHALFAAMFALLLPFQGAFAGDFEATLQKANAYIETAKNTERAVESWERYLSWVNIKTGPTGKERYISYGLYDLSDFDSLLNEAHTATGSEPKRATLDASMTRYIAAYQALAPVINKAAAYYESQGYEKDGLAEGKKLHAQLVPLAKAFIAERDVLMPELRVFVRDAEGQELKEIEKRDGRKAAWQAGNVLHAANRVVDIFPRDRPQPMTSEMLEQEMAGLGPDTPGEKFDQLISGVVPPKTVVIDVKRFGEELANYAKAVQDFDSYSGEKPDDFDDLKPLPRQLLDALSAFHARLTKSKGHEFEGGAQMAGQIVQLYFEMFNAGNGMVGSQLRFLP